MCRSACGDWKRAARQRRPCSMGVWSGRGAGCCSEDVMADPWDHLEQANRHIERAEERVERQRRLVAKLAADGHDSSAAAALLATMTQSLTHMYEHRRTIEAEIAVEAGKPAGFNDP